ncbi:NAD(P)H-binding protein [Mycobacterium sp. Y57]|uniref:NAD(P)H-binding protein n=1 Tax=Mycolicibacterium xanthum TaxID=2796469 RepID=UPI001C848D99|nr:NAD(P)H-binding protein [Mycolicibacterium xanthum]MBX7433854.1 NAD(P)H-binding protein [Mycolicibacterium xanthum]
MRVVIAGGHGKIALATERLLTDRGDSVAAIIRNPDHADDVRAAGADPIVLDLEDTDVEAVAAHLSGADAVIFAAGAGPGSGAARKLTVDRDAAILLADAAEAAGVHRYAMISAMAADVAAPDAAGDPVFVAYLRAKGAADDEVRSRSALHTTIVRPGLLTDEPGTGRVQIAARTGRGAIPRADVAAVLVAVLDSPETAQHTFEVIAGADRVGDAVAALTRD